MTATLPRTAEVLEKGIVAGLHVGAQLYASLQGRAVGEIAVGIARPGVEMTPESMMIWFSSTKATVAVAVAQQWERGRLDIDDPVVRHVPEFGANGKDRITIRHLLTHTGGFRHADRPARPGDGPFGAEWDDLLARICAAAPEDGWAPGRKAGYHPTAAHFVLGEIIRRLDGRPYGRYVREEILGPLGAQDAWVGMPPDVYRTYGDRIGIMHNTENEPRPLPAADSELAVSRCVPGGGGRGPIRDLARLYEMLLGRGERDGVRLLSPQTVEAITARHRSGMRDETFGIVLDWTLGLQIDAASFGRHSSPRTFGHGGARSSVGFCDPEHGVVCAVVCNGMPGHQDHYARMSAITTAVYEDLGVAEPGSPGRDREIPALGLV